MIFKILWIFICVAIEIINIIINIMIKIIFVTRAPIKKTNKFSIKNMFFYEYIDAYITLTMLLFAIEYYLYNNIQYDTIKYLSIGFILVPIQYYIQIYIKSFYWFDKNIFRFTTLSIAAIGFYVNPYVSLKIICSKFIILLFGVMNNIIVRTDIHKIARKMKFNNSKILLNFVHSVDLANHLTIGIRGLYLLAIYHILIVVVYIGYPVSKLVEYIILAIIFIIDNSYNIICNIIIMCNFLWECLLFISEYPLKLNFD